jgi:dihydrofolate synthase / folylpolyglutamate synthase
MRFDTLADWLDWQQQLNPKSIALGLDRVSSVFQRLQLDGIKRVITVAGTNGKGSTVAYYESWLKNAGFSVASYTSPHLLHYNERIRINLIPVSDRLLCDAFDRIDQVREDIQLTYFEFGTLAALVLMSDYAPDFSILEVGLGGRLDAVNIIDADLAHLTPIGLDHQSWLGIDRETIGAEKAGILRKGCLAVCSDSHPPISVLGRLDTLACNYSLAGRDYQYQWIDDQTIQWKGREKEAKLIPPLAGRHQAQNVSGVLAGLELLGCLEGLESDHIAGNFLDVSCAGRLQTLNYPVCAGRLLVDVGHNQQAAQVIASYLKTLKPQHRVTVLLGMLDDKDSVAYVAELSEFVDEWWLVSLPGDRGLTAEQLFQRLSSQQLNNVHLFESANKALSDGMPSLDNQDILLATGSFLTVEAVLKYLEEISEQ